MAHRTVYDCDKCGVRDLKQHANVLAVIDVQYGGPGGGEDIHASVDLCAECAALALEDLLRQKPIAERAQYMKGLKGIK